jgi:YidC/Oxa1 family membrane protein insertase
MDITTLPVVGTALHAGAELLHALSGAFEPLAGGAAAALAVVFLTVAVRLLLVPLSLMQVRAERDRRRLAPAVAALRRRYRGDAARLQRAMTELYTSEKVSPLAGCLPTLAQAPVLSLVYTLFTHGTVAGVANTLLDATLVGIPLGHTLLAAASGALLPQAWVFVVLLAVLGVVVELTRRANLRWSAVDPSPTGAAASVARWAPFVTVVFAGLAPLAAGLYVVTSAAWTLGERAVLRRVVG